MARKAEPFLAKVAKKDRSQNKQGHGSQTLVAKVAKKTWLWPCLPGFTRPHFPGKPGQKSGKPGLASLCLAGREFGQAPDARVITVFMSLRLNKQILQCKEFFNSTVPATIVFNNCVADKQR